MTKIRNGFTMIELIFVIIITAILLILAINTFSMPRTLAGINNFIDNWQYMDKLALDMNKYNEKKEYWFKENVHLKFGVNNDNIYYIIFSDKLPYNNKVDDKTEIIKKNGIYLSGISSEDNGNSNFPSSKQIEKNLNLTKTYKINKLQIFYKDKELVSIPDKNNSFDILINNQGHVYLKEGNNSNIQIKDKDLLTAPLKLEFYGNDKKVKSIFIEPYGLIHY